MYQPTPLLLTCPTMHFLTINTVIDSGNAPPAAITNLAAVAVLNPTRLLGLSQQEQ